MYLLFLDALVNYWPNPGPSWCLGEVISHGVYREKRSPHILHVPVDPPFDRGILAKSTDTEEPKKWLI